MSEVSSQAKRNRSDTSASTTAGDTASAIERLARRLEETMLALTETRAELERVRRERDALHRQLSSVDNMQTATMTLPEEDIEEPQAVIHALPSVEELMASLQSLAAAEHEAAERDAAEHDPAEQLAHEEAGEPEMLPPEVVFPEGVEADAQEAAPPAPPVRANNSKVLVFVDADPPIKYPLFNEVTTIGRSENADIRVDGDYISRVHARIVLTADGAVVEDLASTNGIKVNFKPVDRRQLRHGDILSLGKLHFTFIDTEAGAE